MSISLDTSTTPPARTATPVSSAAGPFPSLLKTADVVRLYDVDESTVRAWATSGYLPSFRVGRTLRFRREDVLALLAPVVSE